MALGTLPPWLDVRPEQFVRAASEGAQAGLAVARLNREADEAAQRSGQQGREFEEAQALRKWEQQQAMQMHAEQMREKQKEQQQQLAALTAYRQSMNEARTQSEKDRQATSAATQKHWQDSLNLQRQRMEGDTAKQGRLQSQETRLEEKSELAGINQRIATVKNQLDKLQIKGSTMTADEQDAYKAAGQELMGLYDQQSKVHNKYAAPPIAQPSTSSIPDPTAGVTPPRNRIYTGPNIGGSTNPKEFFAGLPAPSPTGVTLSPAAPAAPAAPVAPAMPTVISKDQWNALPPGSIYQNKEGKKFRKPDAPTAVAPVTSPIPEPGYQPEPDDRD